MAHDTFADAQSFDDFHCERAAVTDFDLTQARPTAIDHEYVPGFTAPE